MIIYLPDRAGGQGYILVDCETEETVYEGGLDRRSSLDSVQQTLFVALLTGKEPAVVVYDTDGRIGRFEHRIRVACEQAGVRFVRIPKGCTYHYRREP